MRIGINLLYLIPGVVGGTETYAAGLLSGLSQVDKENEYFIFVNQSAATWPIPGNNNFIRIICPVEGPINKLPRLGYYSRHQLSVLSLAFLALYAFAFLFLAMKSGGLWDWLSNIRGSYINKREGNGIYYAGAEYVNKDVALF